jgi:hypothetical protein
MGVENEAASLDSASHIPALVLLDTSRSLGHSSPGDAALGHLPHGATGSKEKDRRLKEKTVVPVVQSGKVETLPKQLSAIDLTYCFLL